MSKKQIAEVFKKLEEAGWAVDSAMEDYERAKGEVGKSLRSVRQAKGMTLRELARKLELSAAFVSDVELGRRYPSQKTMEKILAALK